MTNIFYDTEFIDDGLTIDLISIGAVCEDGRELYYVSNSFDQSKFNESTWLIENVAPSLPMYQSSPYRLQLDPIHPQVRNRAEIRDAVSRFIRDTQDPELWAWYGAYDHVALAQLWGPMVYLPAHVPMYTNDLRSLWMLEGKPTLPKQKDGVHNALEDARHNKVKYDWIMRKNG